jgi:hypothetical protein
MLAETLFVSGTYDSHSIPNAVLKSIAAKKQGASIIPDHRSTSFTRPKIPPIHYRQIITTITATDHSQTITAKSSPPLPPDHHQLTSSITPSLRHMHHNTTTTKPRLARRWSSGAPNTLARSCKPIKGLSPTEQDTSGFPPGATLGERRE